MPKLLRNGEAVGHQRWLPHAPSPPPPPPPPTPDPALVREEIMRQAECEAADLISAARAEAEALKAQARDAGYADGYAAAQAEYQERLGEILALLAEIGREREAFFTRAESDLARLATVVAEKIILRQLALSPDTVVEITRACLKRLRDREEIFIRAHPEDMAILAAARPSLLMDHDGLTEFQLIEDRRVNRGGVIVETKSG